MSETSDFHTTADGGKSFSQKFLEPTDYIYEAIKENSQQDASDFLKYRNEWEASKKFEYEAPFPIYILTEMTFSCNYRCPQCVLGDNSIQKELMPASPKMSFELFKKIIDEAKSYNCKSLCVNNTNEPLLLDDLSERIEYARSQGFLDILMNTNGELFNDENSEKLIKSGLTRLMISVDAHSSETFKKIRVGGNYEKVKENIIKLVKIREKLGQKLPLIRSSFVLQKDNRHELDAFKEYWQKIVDYVHIQEYAKPYETAEDSRVEGYKPDITENFKCDQPWNRVMIRADGEVHPCCSFYTYELKMGNVKNSTISEIWNSENFKKLRKMHFEGRYKDNSTCAKCIGSY